MSLGVGIGGLSVGPRFVMVSEFICLAWSLARRLETPRGSLSWSPNDGTDMRDWLNRSDTPQHRFSAQVAAKDECEKDERVQAALVSAQFQSATSSLILTVSITTAVGPFQLVLKVTALAVTVLDVTG
jgi:hypothetical protein